MIWRFVVLALAIAVFAGSLPLWRVVGAAIAGTAYILWFRIDGDALVRASRRSRNRRRR